MIFLNTRKSTAGRKSDGQQRWATVNPCSYCVFTVHLKAQLHPFRKWLLQDKSRLAQVQMDRYNCAEHWKTKVSIQFCHFFLFGYQSVSCNKGLCLRGSKRPHAPPQTPTRQTIVKTNVVQIQVHTHDNTEEENVCGMDPQQAYSELLCK